jgi:hypothetical protein
VNTRTSNPRYALKFLLYCLAVTGPARVCSLQGTGASKISPGSGAPSFRRLIFATLAATLTALAFTAAPALAAEASCAGLPEPERAHEEQLRLENGSAQLPDCRAYELVSPAGKSGGIGDVLNREWAGQYLNPMQATSDGEAITYNGEAFSQARAGHVDQYVSTRTASGWSTTNVTPPEQPNGERPGTGRPEIVGASATLSSFLVASAEAGQLSPEAPEGYRNIYVSGSDTTVPVPLITSVPTGRSSATFGEDEQGEPSPIVFAPASEDFSRVFFAANAALTEQAPTGSEAENNLYRWTAGKLHVVNVLPSGIPEPGATFGYVYGQIDERAHVVPDLEHAVSANGMRAFWTDEHDHDLYLRETYFDEAGEERERTVLVGEDAKFLSANKEGTKVFFTDENELTSDSTAAPGEPDLYECELVGQPGSTTCSLNDLTVDHNVGGHANVLGLVGISEDGEYVYFVADGALASGVSLGNCVRTGAIGAGEAGSTCNLYLYHDGVVTFVTSLSGEDNQPNSSYEGGEVGEVDDIADWTPEVWARQAEASPNGQFLAFGSHLALTGQTNEGPEIFVYDASTQTLSCASCSPNGESNEGASLPPFGDSYGLYEPRYMLNDGRLFFTTSAGLVPQDVNNERDVYEWQPEGVGSCTSSTSTGASEFVPGARACIALVSSGTSPNPSVFAETSDEAGEEGKNVFFTTSQALVPEEQDGIVEMYDAREGGGFPAPSVAAGCGSSEECQGAAPAPVTLAGVPSEVFSGAGNVAPPEPAMPSVVVHRALTRAQKLALALKACRKERAKKKRKSCEAQARSRYRAKSKGRKSKRASDDRGAAR